MLKFICLLVLAAAVHCASIGSTSSSTTPTSIEVTSTTKAAVEGVSSTGKNTQEDDKPANVRGRSLETTTEKREVVPVLRFENDKKADGSFRFMYESGDQTFREESGTLTNAGTDDEFLEVSGSYHYVDADGNLVEVHYTAGKNGFVPTGTNILAEITAVAKAAADLPDISQEDKEETARPEEETNQRQSRSKAELEKKSDNVKKIEKTKSEDSAKNEKKSSKVETNNEKIATTTAAPVTAAKSESVATTEVTTKQQPAEVAKEAA